MVVRLQECQLHQPTMHYQEHQHVHGPMPGVVKLLLLDGPGDCSAERPTLQDLEGRNLIDTHNPDPLLGKSRRICIAPKDLLRSRLEPGVEARRLPVACAMRLQIDFAQNVTHGPGADSRNDSVRHGLSGQVITRPMRDVQSFGHRLQTSKFDDLRPLYRRNHQVTARMALPLIGEQPVEPKLSIPLTGSPDGGFVALKLLSKDFSPLPGGNTQNNSSTSNLIPGRRVTVSDPLQLREVRRRYRQHYRLASSHRGTSRTEPGHPLSIAGCSNSVQVFVPATLARCSAPGVALRHSGILMVKRLKEGYF